MESKNSDRVALVTGGSRGIGRAIVEELARGGWKVAFTYGSRQAAADDVVESLRQEGLASLACHADVRDFPRAGEIAAEVERTLGPIHLLVNNAGIRRDGALYGMDPQAWIEVIETNLGGTFNYCRAVILGMMKRQGGAVINVASVSGIVGLAGQANYSASKAGIIGFTKALAKEVARFRIRVNAVAPGFIQTEMLTGMPEEAQKRLFTQIPLGSPGSPQQVARAVAFLAGDGADYVTGQVLCVDGGLA